MDEFGVRSGDTLLFGFNPAIDPCLKALDAPEVTHKLAILVDGAQIGTNFVHLATELLAVDVDGEFAQVSTVIPEEFPLLGLGFLVDEVALVLFYPFVHCSDDRGPAQGEQETVGRCAHGIFLIELDVVVEITVQLTRKVAQNALEE